jgi:hypothetical protein
VEPERPTDAPSTDGAPLSFWTALVVAGPPLVALLLLITMGRRLATDVPPAIVLVFGLVMLGLFDSRLEMRHGARAPAVRWLAMASLAPVVAFGTAQATRVALDSQGLTGLRGIGTLNLYSPWLIGCAFAPVLAWLALGRWHGRGPNALRWVAWALWAWAGVVLLLTIHRGQSRTTPDDYLASQPVIAELTHVNAVTPSSFQWTHSQEEYDMIEQAVTRRIANVVVRTREEPAPFGVAQHGVGVLVEPDLKPTEPLHAEIGAIFPGRGAPTHFTVAEDATLTFRRDDKNSLLLITEPKIRVVVYRLPEVERVQYAARTVVGSLRPPTEVVAAAVLGWFAALGALLRRRGQDAGSEKGTEPARALTLTATGLAALLGVVLAGLLR